MPRWSALTDYLTTSGDTCHLTWEQLIDIVGQLPTSASDHRAWWSGDRTQGRAWRAAGFRLADVSLGRSVTFVRQTSTQPSTPTPPPDFRFDPAEQPDVETGSTASDIVLISCSKTKVDHPTAARDLYDSPLFRQ